MARHKYADVIHAWAEGAEIQYRDPSKTNKEWIDCNSTPLWWDDHEYRVRPSTLRYRNFIDTDNKIGVADEHEAIPKDCVWVGDWWEVYIFTIEPKTRIIKYRNYIGLQGKIGVAIGGEPVAGKNISWLSDDWLEVEVEEL